MIIKHFNSLSKAEGKYIHGLEKGDVLTCIKGKKGKADFGMSGLVFEVDSLVEGETYEVVDNAFNGGSYVIDNDGVHIIARPENLFIESKRTKEEQEELQKYFDDWFINKKNLTDEQWKRMKELKKDYYKR